jgi:hypothetical protein
MCIAGNCVGGSECPNGYMGQGTYGECVIDGAVTLENCGGLTPPDGFCVVNNVQTPTQGVCVQSQCESVCDCPDPSMVRGGTAVCGPLTSDSYNDCYFTCENGAACPDGMGCIGGFFCGYGDFPQLDPYADCINEQIACPMGVCAGNGQMPPTAGVCAPTCANANDCPEPPEGGANPVCAEFTNGDTYCIIPCTGGCPDGMNCQNGHCTWPLAEPTGYGDCAPPVPTDGCIEGETCFFDQMGDPNFGVCSQAGCANAASCPDAPETGDAPVTCGDLGGGNTCYLDCSGGQTCPDLMECANNQYCAFPVYQTVLEEDFEGGSIPGTWTLINNDGNVPDPMVNFVTDAFVVADDPAGSQAAVGTSWYAPEAAADDWLISPQVTLGANSILGFQARSDNADFPEDYEVRISTGGDTIADFMAEPALMTVTDEAGTYQTYQIDLSAYANQDVRIAIHLNTQLNAMGFGGVLLYVDNVWISQ